MAKQKDKLTLLKEELEQLLNKGNKTPADYSRQSDIVREIQFQERALRIEADTLAEGQLMFGDAYTKAAEKKPKGKQPKKVTPTFKGSTEAEKIKRSSFESRAWRERKFPTGIPGLPLEGNEAAIRRAKETKKKIKKELDLAEGSKFTNPADRIGIDLPESIQKQIQTTARGLVESNPAGIDPAKQEQFIQDVADEMAAQVEEAARSDAGKMNIMDFSEGNPMIVDTRNGAVKDMAQSVGDTPAAKTYAKEFKVETKASTNSLFNISIGTLESQLKNLENVIENTKGEITNVWEEGDEAVPKTKVLDSDRVKLRDEALQKKVDELTGQRNIVSDLLEEQISTLNKETASIYVKNLPSKETRVKKTWRGDVVRGADGKPILETKPIGDTKEWKSTGKDRVDKILKDLNITGDRIIDVDDFDVMYKSKFENKFAQKDASGKNVPVTKEQLIMTESERLISNWQKQITPGEHVGKYPDKTGKLPEPQLAEPDAVDPDAAKYQTKKEAETRSKFEKSQSPMPNLLKNALQDAGTLPGEAGMISERMEYIEGVNEPRGRDWWSEGFLTESAQPSATKGQKDIGSFRGIGGDIDATGFQIKGVAGQQIDKAMEGDFIKSALKNPLVLETDVIFAYKPYKYFYEQKKIVGLSSGTMQRDAKKNIIPFKPKKDMESNIIMNLHEQLKVKDFIDDEGNLTAEGKKFRVEVPTKPDPKNYTATDDFKKAERIYLGNIEQPAVATVLQKDLPGYEGPELELRAEVSSNVLKGAESKDIDVTIRGNIKDTSYKTIIDVEAEPSVRRKVLAPALPDKYVIDYTAEPKIEKHTVLTDRGYDIQAAESKVAKKKKMVKAVKQNYNSPEIIKEAELELSAAKSELQIAKSGKGPKTKTTITKDYPKIHTNPQKKGVEILSEKIVTPQTKEKTIETRPGTTRYGSKYNYGLKDIASRGIEIPGKVRVTDYGVGAEASFKVGDSDFRTHLEKLQRVKDTKYGKSEIKALALGLESGKPATFGGLKDFNVKSQDVFNILYDEAIEVRNVKKGIEESLMTSQKKATAEYLKTTKPSTVIVESKYGDISGSVVSKFLDKHDLWKKHNKTGEVLVTKQGKKIAPSKLKKYVEKGGSASQIAKSLTYDQLKSIAPKDKKYIFEPEAQRAPKKTFKFQATGILSEKNKFTHLFKQEDYTTLRKSYEKDLAWKAYSESVKNKKGIKKYSSKTSTGTLLKASDPDVVNKFLNQASSAISGDNISQNFYKKDGSFNTKKLTQLAQQRILKDATQFAKESKLEDSKKFLTELKKGIKMVIGKG